VLVDEPHLIAPREGRLLSGDCLQHPLRLGDDPLAIPLCDLLVLGRPLGFLATVLAPPPADPILFCGSSSIPCAA
jgi:hypothetical protein